MPSVTLIRQRAKQVAKRWLLRSRYPHYCPVCQTQGRFRPFGVPERSEALCPQCGSLERHRLAWLFLTRHTDLLSGPAKSLLHVAPEPSLAQRLQSVQGITYFSIDRDSPTASIRMDLMKLAFPDRVFDVMFCSHVLEHVADDAVAIQESFRVLKPSGWAVFLVPIVRESTYEDPTVTDPAERVRLFGQADHVRAYGPDFQVRLVANGFSVRRVSPSDVLGRFGPNVGVKTDEWPLFYCRPAEQRGPASILGRSPR